MTKNSQASAFRVLSATGRLRQQKNNRTRVLGIDVVKEISAASQAASKSASETSRRSRTQTELANASLGRVLRRIA